MVRGGSRAEVRLRSTPSATSDSPRLSLSLSNSLPLYFILPFPRSVVCGVCDMSFETTWRRHLDPRSKSKTAAYRDPPLSTVMTVPIDTWRTPSSTPVVKHVILEKYVVCGVSSTPGRHYVRHLVNMAALLIIERSLWCRLTPPAYLSLHVRPPHLENMAHLFKKSYGPRRDGIHPRHDV